jgi:hypothetical protein
MDRRLAGRLTARYQLEQIADEAGRRFVKARATAPDRLTPEYEEALARITVLCGELGSAIRKSAQDA